MRTSRASFCLSVLEYSSAPIDPIPSEGRKEIMASNIELTEMYVCTGAIGEIKREAGRQANRHEDRQTVR